MLMYDIAFISYDEVEADENWKKLLSRYPYAKRTHGVKGIHQAHIAAAKKALTPMVWFVDADADIKDDFDFSYIPPRRDRDAVHVWRSQNPVNGLEYGHMGVIAYNKRLTLDTNESGLDFTLSRAHEVVPILSGTAHYNADAWMTWRTAFRETLKLRQFIDDKPSIETEGRLRAWLRKGAEVTNGEWSIRGAQDALTFYESVDGNPAELQKSFDWPWLRNLFESNQ